MASGVEVGTTVDFAPSAVCEWSWWTLECVSDNDDSGAVAADQTITLSSQTAVALGQPLPS